MSICCVQRKTDYQALFISDFKVRCMRCSIHGYFILLPISLCIIRYNTAALPCYSRSQKNSIKLIFLIANSLSAVILADAFYSASSINFHFSIESIQTLFAVEHPFNHPSWKTAPFSLDIIFEWWLFDRSQGFHWIECQWHTNHWTLTTVASTYRSNQTNSIVA